MASFNVKVVKLTIEDHPNADKLEIAQIDGYQCVVGKGQYQTGDLAVYIPEQAIVPEWIIEKLNLQGKLAGKDKNRVKAVKLRGVTSQGLLYPLIKAFAHDVNYDINKNDVVWLWILAMQDEYGAKQLYVNLGDDLTELLKITKYEPQIPAHMAGEVWNAYGYTLKYDIENIKNYPDVLQPNEEVVITEKLHGTWCCFGLYPGMDTPIVSSKGQSAKGLAFKLNEANENNLYVKTYYLYKDALEALANWYEHKHVYIVGEIFGAGVQDLHYGQSKPMFRAFDIFVGDSNSGGYLDYSQFDSICYLIGLPTVPLLYKGPWDKQALIEKYTSGKTVLDEGENIREGIVIKPTQERRDECGRVLLKSISDDYLLRKGNATEYN